MDKKLIKPILIIGSIAALALIAWVIWNESYVKKLPTIEIIVAPKSSSIKINDKKGRHGLNYLQPGEYTVDISKDGFETQTKVVNLEQDGKERINLFLIPNREDTMNWYSDNPDDAKLTENINSLIYIEETNRYREENPIIDILPVYEDNFTIKSISTTSSNKPIISVEIYTRERTSPQTEQSYRDEAMTYLKSLKESDGIDISKYYIRFEN